MKDFVQRWNYFVTWTLSDWARTFWDWVGDLIWGITVGLGIGIGLALFAAMAHASPMVPVGHNLVASIEIAQGDQVVPTGDEGHRDISTEDEALITLPLHQDFLNEGIAGVTVGLICPGPETVSKLAQAAAAGVPSFARQQIFRDEGCLLLPAPIVVFPDQFFGVEEDGDGGAYIWGFKVGDERYHWAFYQDTHEALVSALRGT